jgi:hypothetical protein
VLTLNESRYLLRSFRKAFSMTNISEMNENLEQIRLNNINIASIRSGRGTQTQSIWESRRDDSAETIEWLLKCNANLREANAILATG